MACNRSRMPANGPKPSKATSWPIGTREGRYADFHALRHCFITMVGKAGVTPREHQDLARHSTYALTSRYTHSRFYDLAAAVKRCRSRALAGRPNKSVAGHGDGWTGNFPWPKPWPSPAISGDFERQTETESRTFDHDKKTPENKALWRFSRVPNVATTKVEDRGFEPLTS